ncbi:unnamed protein product [Nezara viridula]|uniref:Uncharacterized protein n=1 Tax=Nezara viridula TaxID=85310 RepID=A0A9P0HW04_NEZVI|nr:unnamed protein product [Nezara viridula]
MACQVLQSANRSVYREGSSAVERVEESLRRPSTEYPTLGGEELLQASSFQGFFIGGGGFQPVCTATEKPLIS